MTRLVALLFACLCLVSPAAAADYPDRFVWVFGWNLNRDGDVADISQLLETGAKHGMNGAVLSAGLDTLCKKTPDYFRRLELVQQACDRSKIELIPAIFSVGYGSAAMAHNRNLAEGLPVEDAPFVVSGNEARFVPESRTILANGGFEEVQGIRLKAFTMQDQPGVISFVDTQVKHGGSSSLRMENFTANQHGHGRVMQEISLKPHRSYRMTLWVKTEDLAPAGAFRVTVLTKQGGRELAPRTFKLPATTDWRKVTMAFNSTDFDLARIYTGVWGGKSGKFWLDDWSVEEIGPMNVLHRPGTPVAVKSEDGATTYGEGKDYAPLIDERYSPGNVDRPALPLKLLPGGRIADGQKLKACWYHPMIVNDGQITVCMAEPELYEIFDHEAKLLAERLHPRKVMLNMDEMRMGGTCAACRGRDMGELLGECITKQVQILRKHIPGVEVYIWSDMLDPNHNAHDNYYLVKGSFAGSWKHVPKDLILAVWGGAVREKDFRFCAGEGFRTLASCYYDANDLKEVKGWYDLAQTLPNVRGFMYTPWQKKYELLGDFGDLVNGKK